ncbi:D-2-hydroxyacid dehydrogenase [bacterium 210820-DFI.6.37]|nr:D-2-hydroxyacid dehydrogenase [bacterium 210820-DFI.6.37]
MKSVFLDSAVINPGDISWEPIEKLGDFQIYKRTAREEISERLAGVQAVFVDSLALDRETLKACPDLKFIGIAATGFNHVDLETAEELGIAVCNVPAYSTDAVAQQAIALLLSVTNKVEVYNRAVVEGEWQNCKDYTFIKTPVTLLAGRSLGIVGYGNIGKKVGEIARAFGMEVHVYSQDKEAAVRSDIVTFHCPLTKENAGMVNREFLSRMKDGAILINTARGGLIDEEALAEALKSGKLAGAGLDVMAKEPPEENNPLIGLKNCWITPHIGFIPVETRKVVIDTCGANLESFLNGGTLNRLV